jgi:hypothetical protein
MKIQLITAVAALWSCREKRPDPLDSSKSLHPTPLNLFQTLPDPSRPKHC